MPSDAADSGLPHRGSAHHLARYANDHAAALDEVLAVEAGIATPIRWKSPLASDGYREYQDARFLEALDVGHLAHALRRWWPARGPVWDALGIAKDGTFVLVEAKANVPEMIAGLGSAAGATKTPRALENRELIEQSLATTRKSLQVDEQHAGSWIASHAFQCANRLAHLHFMQRHGLTAHLVYVYFTDDQTHLPTSADAFRAQHQADNESLGLKEEPEWVTHAFVPALPPS